MKEKKNIKCYLTIAIALFTVISALSGCISSDSVSAAEIKMYTLATSININSYEFLMDMTMTSKIDTTEMTMSATGNGASRSGRGGAGRTAPASRRAFRCWPTRRPCRDGCRSPSAHRSRGSGWLCTGPTAALRS